MYAGRPRRCPSARFRGNCPIGRTGPTVIPWAPGAGADRVRRSPEPAHLLVGPSSWSWKLGKSDTPGGSYVGVIGIFMRSTRSGPTVIDWKVGPIWLPVWPDRPRHHLPGRAPDSGGGSLGTDQTPTTSRFCVDIVGRSPGSSRPSLTTGDVHQAAQGSDAQAWSTCQFRRAGGCRTPGCIN